MSASNLNHFRVVTMGLMFECPYTHNPVDCPVHSLRLKPVAERISWVKQLSDEDCRNFYMQHLACLDTKERSGSSRQ